MILNGYGEISHLVVRMSRRDDWMTLELVVLGVQEQRSSPCQVCGERVCLVYGEAVVERTP